MDINSIRDQVSNLTLYDLKAGVRKVQNAVMNFTEMEAKVREATNNEPWGASSTIMQEIANGTHSYQLLNEIMPMIYKRFTEKAAEEWRQIYKALQLLEFLIKNGSERVIDDARSHISLLKMLRQFHYIDQNGKDQGINVRNRSKELAELLSDVDRIRSERKKARANRNKFGGVEGGSMSGGLGGGSRYGGFGSEEAGYGGYSGGVYGDGGGFGGREDPYQSSSSRRDRFEEYDEDDDGGSSAAGRKRPEAASRPQAKAEPPKPKEPAVDFLSFDDDVPPRTPPKDTNIHPAAATSFGSGLGSLGAAQNDEDDFDDFQSATPDTTVLPKPAIPPSYASGLAAPMATIPGQSTNGALSSGLVSPPAANPASRPNAPSMTSSSSLATSTGPNYNINMSDPLPQAAPAVISPQAQSQPQRPTASNYQAATPNYFTSVVSPQQTQANNVAQSAGPARPLISSTNSFTSSNKPAGAKTSSSGGDAFGSLWSTASSSAGIKKSMTANAASGPNLASLQREKASQGLWGHNAASASPGTSTPGGGTLAGGSAPPAQKTGGALDDLLG